MSNDTGKWVPSNLDGSPHRCMKDEDEEFEEESLEPVGTEKPKTPVQKTNGTVVPRMTKPITKAFEHKDIFQVCKWQQEYSTTVESLGAQIHGTTLNWNFDKGFWTMVTWLSIPNNNYDVVAKL